MKKRLPVCFALMLTIALLLSSCNIFHRHTLGEWQYNGSGHFRECSCGYTLSESSAPHVDKDRDEECDLCRYPMKYEINSLQDLSWYLLYYYERSLYEYFEESNMKPHSIHDLNFKNTLTYNERNVRVKFKAPYFNEYLTGLPESAEYVKSNTEYYSHNVGSGYSQHNIPLDYYLFSTQETIRYGSSDGHCDFKKFTETASKFKTVNDFYETTTLSESEKRIYKDTESYNGNNLSFKNEILNSVSGKISHLIRYYLNVEFTEHGDIVLPENSYFDSINVKTDSGTVYFSIKKMDGETFWGDDTRYDINGRIDLKTHNLSYNVKESYYFEGELMSYVDYDYDLTLTNEKISIEFDTSGDFEEVYMDH